MPFFATKRPVTQAEIDEIAQAGRAAEALLERRYAFVRHKVQRAGILVALIFAALWTSTIVWHMPVARTALVSAAGLILYAGFSWNDLRAANARVVAARKDWMAAVKQVRSQPVTDIEVEITRAWTLPDEARIVAIDESHGLYLPPGLAEPSTRFALRCYTGGMRRLNATGEALACQTLDVTLPPEHPLMQDPTPAVFFLTDDPGQSLLSFSDGHRIV